MRAMGESCSFACGSLSMRMSGTPWTIFLVYESLYNYQRSEERTQ